MEEDWTTVSHKKKKSSKPQGLHSSNNQSEENRGYPHQNWDPVVRRASHSNSKPNPRTSQIESIAKYNAGKNTQTKSVNQAKLERQIDNDEYEQPKVSTNLKIQLQQARVAKKWTQKDLAKACNFPLNKVIAYENGSAIPIPSEIVEMGKQLGVHLHK